MSGYIGPENYKTREGDLLGADWDMFQQGWRAETIVGNWVE